MASLNKSIDDMGVLIDTLRVSKNNQIDRDDIIEIIVNSSELLVNAVFNLAMTDEDDVAKLLVEAINIGAKLADLDIEICEHTQSIH